MTPYLCTDCGKARASQALADACCTYQSPFLPVEPGDFIRIPTWHVEGQVTAVTPIMDTDDAIEVLLQERPDGPERWYRLDPTDYEVL